MGVGARRRGARARRVHHHRRRHRHHQRRHHHHHHHRRTGAHHGARQTFPVTGFHVLFGNRRQRTGGGAQTTVTATSSTDGSRSGVCRAPAWLAPLVVTCVLVTLMIAAFAVPSIPFPVGITCTVLFVLIIVVPFVSNVIQTRKARRSAEPDVEAPPAAEEGPQRNAAADGFTTTWNAYTGTAFIGSRVAEGGPNVVDNSAVFYGGPSINMEDVSIRSPGVSGQPNTDYAYDPPPSFTEATAASLAGEPAAGLPDFTQQGLHTEAAVSGAVEPNMAGPTVEAPAATDEPPPPSYEEAVAGDTV
ncbi:uncharacterized protein LOC110973712 [Acanthaster planci]|uniref:Uncharacterized protein LOC110973712 n=1 Tax=Acanthaster planci TaxID=133434 RepID=A0A8B7XJS5_ACAPL|nr:uncharacterized protein LOC110973712 [Acanthaster planci]XP_022080423.1 uncharacterized protein LOC110973712 [Acanthaster planci]XP_022080424.1 uncharacterized protein LOC110973712 [Acanthaster planci]